MLLRYVKNPNAIHPWDRNKWTLISLLAEIRVTELAFRDGKPKIQVRAEDDNDLAEDPECASVSSVYSVRTSQGGRDRDIVGHLDEIRKWRGGLAKVITYMLSGEEYCGSFLGFLVNGIHFSRLILQRSGDNRTIILEERTGRSDEKSCMPVEDYLFDDANADKLAWTLAVEDPATDDYAWEESAARILLDFNALSLDLLFYAIETEEYTRIPRPEALSPTLSELVTRTLPKSDTAKRKKSDGEGGSKSRNKRRRHTTDGGPADDLDGVDVDNVNQNGAKEEKPAENRKRHPLPDGRSPAAKRLKADDPPKRSQAVQARDARQSEAVRKWLESVEPPPSPPGQGSSPPSGASSPLSPLPSDLDPGERNSIDGSDMSSMYIYMPKQIPPLPEDHIKLITELGVSVRIVSSQTMTTIVSEMITNIAQL